MTLSTADTLTYEFESTENGAEGKIECKVGDQIEVSFAENNSAGYQWQIVETTLQADTCDLIWTLSGSEYTEPEDDGMVGKAGTRKFVVQVDKPGDGYLTFVYGKMWMYDQMINDLKSKGKLDARIVEGAAIQLKIEASEE